MPEPRSSESPKSPSWSEWKARNGSKLWCWRAPLAVEWALEWFVNRLRGLALFDLLELAGRTTVLIAAIFWLSECDDRTKQSHYRAWELINSARGSTGDGGRRDALQDLNRDHVSLAAAPLEQAWLREIDLRGADLIGANLERAILSKANLQGARLFEANLRAVSLREANLQRADLGQAILQGTDLEGADLRGANIFLTNLQDVMSLRFADLRGIDFKGARLPRLLEGVNLRGADLAGKDLRDTDLEGADLRGANLRGANLQGAVLGSGFFDINNNFVRVPDDDTKLKGADLGSANLQNAKYLAQEQLDAANGDDRTVLPHGLTRPPHWSKAEASEGRPAAQPDDAERAPATAGAPGSDK